MAETEKWLTEYTRQSLDAIDRFSLNYGLNRINAVQRLIAIGDYVASELVVGKEFLVTEGKKMQRVDWQLPQSQDYNA
jgi:hypothetical protein